MSITLNEEVIEITLETPPSLTMVVGIQGPAGSTGGTYERLLSSEDSIPADPVAGDIVYANSTPKWTRRSKGSENEFLQIIGGLPSWGPAPVVGVGGEAPVDASYVCLATNGTLTDERVLIAGNALFLTDGGAGSSITVDVLYTTPLSLDGSNQLTLIAGAITESLLDIHSEPASNKILFYNDTQGKMDWVAQNLLSDTHADTVGAFPALGDIIYANTTPKWTKLAGNITTTKKYLAQVGTGAVSAAPAWETLSVASLRSATYIIAASNSIDTTRADYVCDGINDEVQIQTAINLINAAGVGGKILFLEGSYNIATNITGQSHIIFEGCNISNHGAGTIFNLSGHVDMFTFTSETNIMFRNIKFHGNYSTYGTHKILNFYNCDNVKLYDCNFLNCAPAIYATRPWEFWTVRCGFVDSGYQCSATTSVIICHNGATDNGSGWYFLHCNYGENTPAANMPGTFFYSDASGASGQPNNNIQFLNCGIESWSTSYPVIYGRFYASKFIGSWFYQGTGVLLPSYNLVELTTGSNLNTFSNCFFWEAKNYGLKISGNKNTISGNTFYQSGSAAYMRIETGSDNKIIGNMAETTTKALVSNAGTRTVMALNGGSKQGLWIDPANQATYFPYAAELPN
ncbi:hypothetical protein KKA69_04380, partial [Patescibacteria group bacterium]|nr:hypothetical protein [Patescibacteria group bacterium]